MISCFINFINQSRTPKRARNIIHKSSKPVAILFYMSRVVCRMSCWCPSLSIFINQEHTILLYYWFILTNKTWFICNFFCFFFIWLFSFFTYLLMLIIYICFNRTYFILRFVRLLEVQQEAIFCERRTSEYFYFYLNKYGQHVQIISTGIFDLQFNALLVCNRLTQAIYLMWLTE